MSQHSNYDEQQRHALHLNLSMKEADARENEELGLLPESQNTSPSVCGMPLKYVSLVTLAVQNALLTLIMHYSRVSAAPSETYSAAAAVLMTELLKGSISLVVAFTRLDCSGQPSPSIWNPHALLYRFRRLGKEVFRPDCWKLSIPAILYVIQNNLQFVAVSNLDAATFQVSYQMKILTTAAFSVVLLRRRLSPTKWLALLFLAIGVGIVQIQSGHSPSSSTDASHDLNAFKGFMAVVAACFTSGLAGVYFEMVLKNSPADLWVRNVQLSLFSLLPALLPIVFSKSAPSPTSGVVSLQLFAHFGVWAWATVCVQVLGGLLTALVIKYADNILKGFATSLSIVISFLASVALFNFQMTLTFILGSSVVLVATWMYNQPDTCGSDGRSWNWRWQRPSQPPRGSSALEFAGVTLSRRASTSSLSSLTSLSSITGPGTKSYPGSPVERDAPSLSQLLEKNLVMKKQDDPSRLAAALSAFSPLRAAARMLSRTPSGYQPVLPTSSSVPAMTFSTSENTYAFPPHSPAFQPQPVLATSLTSSTSYPPLSSRPPSALSSHVSRPTSAMGHAASLSAPADFVSSHHTQ
ncbi:hypothetical protein POSPLADRAFT_1167334 [Postia placenta MAD-698-R-SB12]|uniref:UDP-galactose transporter n=1 Tax=Postia placenta MAD-698-R-SB12 TaxID=670580 RepID=A0A1X6N9U8_9APHY|nr:hypothetical protein POSPLADRAFT_1167334 [Postia placenta MAD-698-R-SB12]OSX65133.1 hypothetical protein POSPLADRAFT_1167334 [Postia placenta MAD-698-R-SB12]